MATPIRALVLAGVLLAASCGDDGVASVDSGDAATGARRPLALTAADATPAVDVSIHAVPLDEIVFDTFDGGSVTLTEVDDATIERLFDAIVPIDGPDYESVVAAGEWLTDDDLVVSYIDDAGAAWAYPVRILNFHEIVNDELAGRPVLVSYCPLCASAVVYDRVLDDVELAFSNTSALHDNDMVMVDRETGSYWWQVAGRGIVGTETGAELDPLPSEMVRWSDWEVGHPAGRVLARLPGRSYDRDPFVGYGEVVDSGSTPFPVDPNALADGRLPPATRVVAASVAGATRAWPVSPPIDVEDRVGGIDVRVVTDGTGGTVVDGVTGTELGVRSSFWFAIVASFPDVTVGP